MMNSILLHPVTCDVHDHQSHQTMETPFSLPVQTMLEQMALL